MTVDVPHVVFFGHSAKPSGTEISMFETAKGVTAVRPTVLLSEEGPIADKCRDAGVNTVILPLDHGLANARRTAGIRRLVKPASIRSWWQYRSQLRAMLSELRPDLIVSNTTKTHLLIALASVKVPTIFHIHDRLTRETFSRTTLALLRCALWLFGHAFLANSKQTLDTIPRRRSQTLRAILPPPIPSPPSQAKPPHTGPMTFGMAARLAPWKGHELAIRAFARAFSVGDERLVIAGGTHFGEDNYSNRLERLASSLNLSERIEFLGHVPDIYATMQQWDALVHASLVPEPFGQIVAQAMSASLPIVASAEGAPLDILDDFRAATYFAPRDIESLTSALIQTRDQRDDLLELAAQDGPKLAERFRPEHVCAEFELLVHRILESTPNEHTNADP